jgi:hypothetical protein
MGPEGDGRERQRQSFTTTTTTARELPHLASPCPRPSRRAALAARTCGGTSALRPTRPLSLPVPSPCASGPGPQRPPHARPDADVGEQSGPGARRTAETWRRWVSCSGGPISTGAGATTAMAARASRSRRTMALRPKDLARCSAVQPTFVVASASAPLSSSRRTMDAWHLELVTSKGVLPFPSRAHTSPARPARPPPPPTPLPHEALSSASAAARRT